jgi:hypothetical protein
MSDSTYHQARVPVGRIRRSQGCGRSSGSAIGPPDESPVLSAGVDSTAFSMLANGPTDAAFGPRSEPAVHGALLGIAELIAAARDRAQGGGGLGPEGVGRRGECRGYRGASSE